jgi:hypothetical protein
VVLDRQEGKQYDGVGEPTFSPDSKRFAYTAIVGEKQFVVLDGQEGKQYKHQQNWCFYTYSKYWVFMDKVFDPSNSFRYIVREGAKVYLVEEK